MIRCLAILCVSFLSTNSLSHPMFQNRIKELLKAPLPDDLYLGTERQGELFKVVYQPVTAHKEIPLSKLHNWNLKIIPMEKNLRIGQVFFKGSMPRHLHGLPSAVTVKKQEESQYLVEGIKFHMPGWWQLETCIEANRGNECIRFDLIL